MNATMDMAAETSRLVLAARQGSREAFAQLVRLHHELVRSFLCRHVSHADVADDLAQEVFLVAFRRMGEFRGDARFSTWLLGISRKLALEYLRRESRRKRRDVEAAVARWRAERLVESEDDPARHETALSALRGCVDALPEDSRRVVERFYFENESAESIARRAAKKAGAIRMMLMRIRKALSDCVESKLQGREHES